MLGSLCIFAFILSFGMQINFTAIDFETAHYNYPCEIGLTRVEDGILTKSVSYLIKPACFPYMNPNNESVHGISSEHVADAPTFEELWGEVRKWIEDEMVVAHNAMFDMWVLRSALAYYDLAMPWVDYFCSVQLSRKVWKQLPSHSLSNLCSYHNIKFNHHQAEDDAKACAQITLKAFEEINCTDLEKGLSNLGISIKRLKAE